MRNEITELVRELLLKPMLFPLLHAGSLQCLGEVSGGPQVLTVQYEDQN